MEREVESETEVGAPSTTETLDDNLSRTSALAHQPARGDTVGRFVLLSKLGEGGMGVVWAAHDAELDRKVAVKLLRTVDAGLDTSTGPSRLVREAQALARLSHPNVVTVHDVGSVGERVWIAMEYVDGKTLGAWLAERPRRWPQILAVLRDAGAGLAAAHAKALVHRDFKPDNVMVGDDGRVRVMDFGLAREHEGGARPTAVDRLAESSGVLSTELTAMGSIMGTPAYMAPEQHLGLAADARSDQFSFCVSAWEALYGERPFRGSSPASLAVAVTEGRREPAPRGHGVPARIRRALERGLAVEPADRHADMNALLAELTIDGSRIARWALLGALPLLALAFVFARGAFVPPAGPPPCAGMESQLAEVWNAERRAAVEQAIAAVDVGYAKATAEQVGAGLEEYARLWIDSRRDACEATRVRGDQSEELMDRRIACLDERRLHLRSLVEVLEDADATVIAKAVDAVSGLPRLEPCADAGGLLAEEPVPDDPKAAAEVEEIRGQLARVSALEQTAQYDLALSVAEEARAGADALELPWLRDRAGVELAHVLTRKGRYDEAGERARDGYYSSLARGDLATASTAARRLAALDQVIARYDEGQWWARQAEALAQARQDEVGRAHALKYLGLLQSSAGEYEAASKTMTQALELFAGALGDDHVHTASMLTNLGGVKHRQAHYDDAIADYRRALPLLRAGYGADHPTVATTLTNLGGSLQAANRRAEAREALEAAVASYERMFGVDHPDLAGCLMNLGMVEREDKNLARALELNDRAQAIWTKHLGESHPNLALVHLNRSDTLLALQRLDEARAAADAATSLLEAAHGSEHPMLIEAHRQQAEVAKAQRRFDDAWAQIETALAIARRTHGEDSDRVAWIYLDLSEIARERGRFDEAREHAQRTLDHLEAHDAPPHETASPRAALARAAWDLPAPRRDRAAALALAQSALADMRSNDGANSKDLAELEDWLRVRGGLEPSATAPPPTPTTP